MTYITDIKGVISTNNSTTVALNADATFEGNPDDVKMYTEINISIYSDKNSNMNGISIQFSQDGTNWDNIYKYTILENQSRDYSFPIISRYFRIVYTNGSEAQTNFRIQTLYHNTKNSSRFGQLNYTGNSNVYVNNSTSSFGELLVAELNPVVEIDFVYGINNRIVDIQTNGSTAYATDSEQPFLTLGTGTNSNGYSSMKSIELANYRPGQGLDNRFTAIFNSGTSDSTQIIGVGNEDNGYFFGYNGVDFGILRRTGGIRKIVTLTLTNSASASTDISIELNGNTLNSISVTQNLSISENAAEISSASFNNLGSGWNSIYNGNEIIFVALSSEPREGSYSFTPNGSGIIASFTENSIGLEPSDYWVSKNNWNIDNADGTGDLPNINFQYGNVYNIKYQWLGFGSIIYSIEDPITGLFSDVHRIYYGNTSNLTSTKNPKSNLFISITKTAGASNIEMKVPSMASLITGNFPINSVFSNSASSTINVPNDSNNFYAILSIRNKYIFKSRINTINATFLSISMYNDSTKEAEFIIVYDAVVKGSLSWNDINNTVISYSTGTGIIDINNYGKVIYRTILSPNSSKQLNKNDILFAISPGSIITIGASNKTSAADMTVSVNWIDDLI